MSYDYNCRALLQNVISFTGLFCKKRPTILRSLLIDATPPHTSITHCYCTSRYSAKETCDFKDPKNPSSETYDFKDRTNPARETYDFKEPTNGSHPILYV